MFRRNSRMLRISGGIEVKFLTTVISLPFIGIFLYTALYPKESTLLGKRWQFKNENLEPSDAVIKKIVS